MRITPKQREEVEFLMKNFGRGKDYTEEHVKQFVEVTVHGKKVEDAPYHGSFNPILDAKRFLEITIPMWKEDMIKGMLSVDELYKDFDYCRYGKNLINSVLLSLKVEAQSCIAAMNYLRKQELLKKK